MQNLTKKLFFTILSSIFLYYVFTDLALAQTNSDWSMAGANPQRTSWVSQESTGNLVVEWYRPIEAYIPQHVQLVTFNNIVYVSTGKGLYALNATNGETVWHFDTELPMGHSPTVFEGKVYVGNLDKKLYCLDAASGQLLWSFNDAQAGYSVNPIVIRDSYTNNQPIVLIGNRDGNFYAIGAHGHPQQGGVIWKYTIPNNSSIIMSAAYKDGVVYTTAMNNRLYALNINTTNPQGQARWISGQWQGEPFMAYWPVIYRDKVILVKSSDIKDGFRPGSQSIIGPDGVRYGDFGAAERASINAINPGSVVTGSEPIGETLPPTSWSGGYNISDARYAREYLEQPTSEESANDPVGRNRYNHKPWRREYYVINQTDGTEFTFDSDGDGLREYIPLLYWRAESGPMYPPAVGPNNLAYFTAQNSRGRIMSWNLDAPSQLGFSDNNTYALDEPLSISMAGNRIYTSLCCDRPALSFSINSGGQSVNYWNYTLSGSGKAPGYDEMWWVMNGAIDRHQSSYVGARDWYGTSTDGVKTTNATMNSHGVQNPLVPHNGRLFIHRSNAIIALGPGPTQQGKKTYLPIVDSHSSVVQPNLTTVLENEISKMINAGHLRAGYHVQNQLLAQWGQIFDYFTFPGDTLLALARAYPHLSSNAKTSLANYMREEWSMYFYPTAYATRGFAEGADRQPLSLPPEITADYANYGKSLAASGNGWQYPQHSIYAIWKYAQNVPEGSRPPISELYQVARSKTQVPATSDTSIMASTPYNINSWIAGYYGYLGLYTMMGSPSSDATFRNNVQNELNRLLSWRSSAFTKESYAYPNMRVQHKMDTSANFIWLTPELADYLVANIPAKVNQALDEYLYLNQYWFVNRFENDMGESSTEHFYNYHALFLAKAWIRKESRSELLKYLDVPAWERGDLFYIQNLVAAIEAPQTGGDPTATPTVTPTPLPGDANGDGRVDGVDYVIWLSHFNQNTSRGRLDGDFNSDGVVNGSDYVIWVNNYSL